MKVLLMKKDGVIHKVSELNRTKVQDKLDAGFVIVGSEDLDAPDEYLTQSLRLLTKYRR